MAEEYDEAMEMISDFVMAIQGFGNKNARDVAADIYQRMTSVYPTKEQIDKMVGR